MYVGVDFFFSAPLDGGAWRMAARSASSSFSSQCDPVRFLVLGVGVSGGASWQLAAGGGGGGLITPPPPHVHDGLLLLLLLAALLAAAGCCGLLSS
jgi:hypothetical protein